MPLKINNKSAPKHPFKGHLLCLGCGKSSGFIIGGAGLPQAMVFSQWNAGKKYKIKSPWKAEKSHQFQTTNDLAEVEKLIAAASSSCPLTIACTTDPQKFEEYLDKILPLIPLDKKPHILFFLPHSPNSQFQRLKKAGFTAAIIDYFPGIGDIFFDDKKQEAHLHSGVKERLYCDLTNLQGDKNYEQILSSNIRNLTLNQNLSYAHEADFQLCPTNALLHLCGNIAHICVALDCKILDAQNSAEIFALLDGKSREEIIEQVGGKLQGAGFYRQMPKIGPDILMEKAATEIAALVLELQKRGICSKEFPHHISPHLRQKYKEQWNAKKTYGSKADEVKLSQFINENPPYQNRAITMPCDEKGFLKTQHRFYFEEIPTLKAIIEAGKALKIEMPILNKLVEFGEKMLGRSVENYPHISLEKQKETFAEKSRQEAAQNLVNFSGILARI